jgi:hypothetical protein
VLAFPRRTENSSPTSSDTHMWMRGVVGSSSSCHPQSWRCIQPMGLCHTSSTSCVTTWKRQLMSCASTAPSSRKGSLRRDGDASRGSGYQAATSSACMNPDTPALTSQSRRKTVSASTAMGSGSRPPAIADEPDATSFVHNSVPRDRASVLRRNLAASRSDRPLRAERLPVLAERDFREGQLSTCTDK